MSQRRTVYQWFQVIAQRMVHLSKPQAFNLAAASIGLALAKRCTLTHIAEQLWSLGRTDPMERRLQRFLANMRITGPQSSAALTAWALAGLAPGTRVVLLVDETSLGDKLKAMVVSLAYRGRALPLAWWCYPQERWPMSQVELITALLGWVAAGVPRGRRVLVQADRGIGNSPRLLQAIEGMGWCYLVRVGNGVRLRLPDGRVEAFGSMLVKPGSSWSGRVAAFKKAGWMASWAVGAWHPDSPEPWLLLTNDPQAQAHGYALRMWEEEAFRDFKSNGWQWQRSHVWNPQHANRLWLVMAVAYLWVISLGTQVLLSARLRQLMTRGKKVRLSVFHLGLRYFHHLLATYQTVPRKLVLLPCEKSVV